MLKRKTIRGAFVLSPSLVELCCMSEEYWVKLKSTAEVGDYAYPLQGRILI